MHRKNADKKIRSIFCEKSCLCRQYILLMRRKLMCLSEKYGEVRVASVNIFSGSVQICFRNFTAVYFNVIEIIKMP
jgi:hypothetical protein